MPGTVQQGPVAAARPGAVGDGRSRGAGYLALPRAMITAYHEAGIPRATHRTVLYQLAAEANYATGTVVVDGCVVTLDVGEALCSARSFAERHRLGKGEGRSLVRRALNAGKRAGVVPPAGSRARRPAARPASRPARRPTPDHREVPAIPGHHLASAGELTYLPPRLTWRLSPLNTEPPNQLVEVKVKALASNALARIPPEIMRLKADVESQILLVAPSSCPPSRATGRS